MHEFKEAIIIESPLDQVWEVLADIGTIATWNPAVVASKLTSEGAVSKGATRHCDLSGKKYLKEEVVNFNPPHSITFSIKESNLPFEQAHIRFTLFHNSGLTKVTVSPLYELKYGFLGDLLNSLFVRRIYQKGMKALLHGLKDHVETGSKVIME